MKGVVKITASSHMCNQCHQVTDYAWNEYWVTNDEPNSWICFDFKEKRLCLTGYSLKSGESYYLLHWVIEGSDDGDSWHKLDRRDARDLKGKYVTKTFECEFKDPKSFRYIRLRQTGKNIWENDHLCLSEIEFFGVL